MKHWIRKLGLAAAACTAASSAVAAADITFDTTPVSLNYTTLTLDGVTITRQGEKFAIASWAPGAPLSGRTLSSWTLPRQDLAFRAELPGGFHAFSISMGDYGNDDDDGRLEAYDATGQLLDSDRLLIAADTTTGGTLTVSSATPIAYVLFYEVGSFAGTVAWDNISYTPAVPEPQTWLLMGMGLSAVGWVARRRRS